MIISAFFAILLRKQFYHFLRKLLWEAQIKIKKEFCI